MSLLSWVSSANDSSKHELSSWVYYAPPSWRAWEFARVFLHFIVCLTGTDLAHNIDVCRAMNLVVLLWFHNCIAVPKSVPGMARRMR